MSDTQTLLTLSDNLLTLSGLLNEATTTYLSAATVTVVLTDKDTGTQIPGSTWPATMALMASSSGNYQATLSHNLTTVVGQRIEARITANDAGTGLQRVFVTEMQVENG